MTSSTMKIMAPGECARQIPSPPLKRSSNRRGHHGKNVLPFNWQSLPSFSAGTGNTTTLLFAIASLPAGPPPLIVGGRWCISIHWWNSSTNCCCCYDCSNALKLLYSFPSFSGSDRGEMTDAGQFNLFFYELLLIYFDVKVKIRIDLKYFYCLFDYRPIETSCQNWKKNHLVVYHCEPKKKTAIQTYF